MCAAYCSIDPATAIIKVAVHKGFETLDIVPHVLTALTVTDLGRKFALDTRLNSVTPVEPILIFAVRKGMTRPLGNAPDTLGRYRPVTCLHR